MATKPLRKPVLRPQEVPEQKYVPKNRVRVVTAASLFDGHDAAINIMRRILQSTGAEVIHLGHNRSAEEIVTTAIQEDASAIAVSSYQGGHMEFFAYILKLLHEQRSSHIKVFGGGGGTLTNDEIVQLEKQGVTKIYSPEDGRKMGLQGIINDIVSKSDISPLAGIDWLKLCHFGTPKSIAQALTCLELGESAFTEALKPHLKDLKELKSKLALPAKSGVVVGITGPGGAGKSSIMDEIIGRLLEGDPKARIGVLAVDPTRKKTGGALLGDRLRMNSLKSCRCFMRSFATREANVSLSAATAQAIALLRASGFDWIFVETGGIGQADTSVVNVADINIYIMTSEFGAATQLEKINMLDYADLIILNKFDRPGSLDALTEVRHAFRRNHIEWEAVPLGRYPIVGTIASRFGDPGVDAAFEHLRHLKNSALKRKPLDQDFERASLLCIVPSKRTDYLSDIAGVVREYREHAEKTIAAVRRLESIETLLGDPTFSDNVRSELKSSYNTQADERAKQALVLLEQYKARKKLYESDTFTYSVRDREFRVPLVHKSLSQNKIRKITLPHFSSQADLIRFLLLENLPGYFPYTAGVFPLKRVEEEPKRMFAGEGPPTRTNRRFHLLCVGEKAKRLSTAFDSVTLYGEDPHERPDIYGKIGESGVSICSLDDMKKLYAGFNLCDPNVSVSMTINGPAPMMLAFFFNTAIDQQTERFTMEKGRNPSETEKEQLRVFTLQNVRGTVQADILKEDQAQNTCIFSTEFALRMMGDIQQYFIANSVHNYYSVSISGYHIAEAGANPITQLAFTLANGFTYVEYYLSRAMNIDDFAPNFSFFFSNGLDAEYTVIGRVARRIWAIAMKNLYHANDRSQKLKYHVQTSGRSLHAREISFNDIRTTLQALIAYFDFCNSLHTNASDEAITTPTEESVRRAMAIQMIIAREFGWAKNENPLQGSFFIEALTDLVEEAVLAEFDRLSLRQGVLGAMESQYQRSKIQEESLAYERQKHSGELPIIGINTFLNPQEGAVREQAKLSRASYEEKNEQIKNLREFQKRHADEAPQALQKLKDAVRRGDNIFAALMESSQVCSLGQMTHALYEIGGQYRRNA